MKRGACNRALVSVAVACGLLLSGIERMPQTSVMEAAAAPTERTTLRVGMWTLWRDREVVLTPAGPGRTINFRSCEQCATISLPRQIEVRADGNAVTFTGSGRAGHAYRLWLAGLVTLSAHGESVTLRNPVAIMSRAGVLVIVVTLPVEEYAERVVASESGTGDGAASLRALAIVVRTFALHEVHGHADYDLCDSTHCQLLHWSGSTDQRGAARAATLATTGETLWFHGERALGYFHKDCGGRTAMPDEVWPRAKRIAYLPSATDPYCTAKGGREWSSEIPLADLTAALATHGLVRSGWHSLSVASRSQSGRAETLRLDSAVIQAEAFQLAVGETLGWSKIPSTWFEVRRQGERFEFHGRGWGHGVGLCQTGAAVMAEQGRLVSEILAQYFPGAEAADEESGRAWQRFSGSGLVLESLSAADAAYLPELARARAEASSRSGLNTNQTFIVRAFNSTPAFREATLAPGWVAAFTEGNWTATQSLRKLSARHLLAETMRHEFLHSLVEQETGPRTPLWLREGLVEAWSEDASGSSGAPSLRQLPRMKIGEVDTALAHAATEAESEEAHEAAGWYAAQLLARYGRAQVLDWLRSGVPGSVFAVVGQR